MEVGIGIVWKVNGIECNQYINQLRNRNHYTKCLGILLFISFCTAVLNFTDFLTYQYLRNGNWNWNCIECKWNWK